MREYYHGDAVMRIIEEFKLDFLTGQVCKYILRAGNKPGNSELRDLQKAKWYLDRKIQSLAQAPPEENPLSAIEVVSILAREAQEARAVIRHAIQIIEWMDTRPTHAVKDRDECLEACHKVLLTDRANRFPGVL